MDLNNREDCFYFLYSTCTKGTDCPFRHQENCRKNETLCREWENKNTCSNTKCSSRHSLYHLDKKRSEISCYWEMNGGCKKMHCPFKHEHLPKDNNNDPSECNLKSESRKDPVHNNSRNALSSSSSLSLKKLQQNEHLLKSPSSNICKSLEPTKRSLGDVRSIDKSFVKASKKESLNFEVKSFDQIMKEKKLRLTNQQESIQNSLNDKSEKSVEVLSLNESAVSQDNDDSVDLDDIDKELDEMNQLLSQ